MSNDASPKEEGLRALLDSRISAAERQQLWQLIILAIGGLSGWSRAFRQRERPCCSPVSFTNWSARLAKAVAVEVTLEQSAQILNHDGIWGGGGTPAPSG